MERVFSYYTQTKTLRRYSLDVSTVDALIRIRFNGPKSLQDFDTFRFVWEFLDSHSRSDDMSLCAHRSVSSKEPQNELCEEMQQAFSATDTESSVGTSTNMASSSSFSNQDYDNPHGEEDGLDYDISGIVQAIELEERNGEAV